MAQAVIMDMDPGIDDALALVAAMHRLPVIGVSTVAGNASVDNTFQNAHRILRAVGRTVPVYRGAERPLFYALLMARDIHGFSGLGAYPVLDPPAVASPIPSWEWMAQTIRQRAEPCHLLATGPLTNVALLLWSAPDVAQRLASITCLGGAMPGTRMDKAYEFNVYVDPHAADVVFRYGRNVSLIGVDLAHRVLMPLAEIERFRRYGSAGQLLHEVLGYYAAHARGEGGDPTAMPVDDVLVVAAHHRPELFRWQEMPLTVVHEGPLRGTVVVAPYAAERQPVKVATDIDLTGFFDWLWESFERPPA
jgi:inosine-uridine nucleoside N-ribohydrolase